MKAPRSLAGSIGFTSILSEDSGHDEVDRPHHRSRERPTQELGMETGTGMETGRVALGDCSPRATRPRTPTATVACNRGHLRTSSSEVLAHDLAQYFLGDPEMT